MAKHPDVIYQIIRGRDGVHPVKQAIRYPKDKFSQQEAVSDCRAKEGKFAGDEFPSEYACRLRTPDSNAIRTRRVNSDPSTELASDEITVAMEHTAGMASTMFTKEGKRFVKFFLIGRDLNLRGWKVTEASIQCNMKTAIGRPYISEPELAHFGADEQMPVAEILKKQEQFRVGNIVNVQYDENTKEAFAVVEITDDKVWQELMERKAIYVSPAIAGFPVLQPDGSILYDEWYVLHLARVDKPAYGVMHASLKRTCEGEEKMCIEQLMAAASENNTFKDLRIRERLKMDTDKVNVEQLLKEVEDQKAVIATLTKEKQDLEGKFVEASKSESKYKDLEGKFAALEKEQREKIATEIADLKVEGGLLPQDKHKDEVAKLVQLDKQVLISSLDDIKGMVAVIQDLRSKTASTPDRQVHMVKTASAEAEKFETLDDVADLLRVT